MLMSVAALGFAAAANGSPNKSPTVSQVLAMPVNPRPFHVRNWHAVTLGYLDTIFNDTLKGPLLPAIRWPATARYAPFLPSYLGGGGPEAINYIAAIVSGRLAGLHMSHFQGHDLLSYVPLYYNSAAGVFANNPNSTVPTSFWYELLPNILAFQMYALGGSTNSQLAVQKRIADQWYRVSEILTTAHDPNADFNYTGFNFTTMTPLDNHQWKEPDGAAGVAWIEFMAWRKFHKTKYLHCAIRCVNFLAERKLTDDPLYETLLPYGALAAARLNAQAGTHFNIAKLVNWCFTPGYNGAARPGWGVLNESAGQLSMAGLVGSSTDTHGYAFAMNTFEWAGALTPIARYDSRYAAPLGRWLLNLASNARLFYSNSMPATNQDCYHWCSRNDPHAYLPYEGLRLHPRGNSNGPSPFATGDAMGGGGPSNLCLYGGSHVGILAAIVHRTNVRKILRLNLLGTDYHHGKAYPTNLYFNPYALTKAVRIKFGAGIYSLYDTVSHHFIARNISGSTTVRVQPQHAVVLVTIPAKQRLDVHDGRLMAGDTVVDWHYRNF